MTFLAMPSSPDDWPTFLDEYCLPRLEDARGVVASLSEEPPSQALEWVDYWT